MLKNSFLMRSIKTTSAFALLLLISSSQSDCSSSTQSAIHFTDTSDKIGSCFTRQQNGYLPALQAISIDQDIAVTGNKYHF